MSAATRLTRCRPGQVPTADEIRSLRERLQHSRTDAAALLFKSVRVWEKWELGTHPMEPAFWELYLRKSGVL